MKSKEMEEQIEIKVSPWGGETGSAGPWALPSQQKKPVTTRGQPYPAHEAHQTVLRL